MKVVRKLFPFWKLARTETCVGMALAAFAVGVELLQPWPIKWVVDYILGSHAPPAWLNRWLFILGPEEKTSAVLIVCATIVLLALVQKSTHVLSSLLLIRAGEKLVCEI